MKIAFPLIDKNAWRGGYNYLLNLFSALEKTVLNVEPVLYAGEEVNPAHLASFQSLQNTTITTSRLFNRKERARRLLQALVTGKDARAEKLFIQHGIDVVFENALYFGRRFKLPVIAWLPDFQHRHLPGMFSRFGYWRRELGFRRQVSPGRCLLLSSRDARRDLDLFYPACRATPHVIPFAVEVAAELLTADPDTVRERYRLPPHFFFLPNQFYRHKNHALVLSALARLKAAGREFVVAASGNPEDPRGTENMKGLRRQIHSDNLEANFIFLGSIPYKDVVGLMRRSAALLNPSLFEGWSTAVEEAKALGVPLILSDLGVHREQADGFAVFFKRHSAASLAAALAACPHRDAPQQVVEQSARRTARQRLDTYARKFAAMARQCCDMGRQGTGKR